MSVIDPQDFAPHLSDEQAWEVINALPVSYLRFAHLSYYYHRLFNVNTGSQDGVSWEQLNINDCFRGSLWRGLYDSMVETERRVGYNLTARYHAEEVNFPELGNGQTLWPGVAYFNAAPSWATVAGYESFDVKYLVQEGVSIADPLGQPIATVDATLFENPSDVILRNHDTGGAYVQLSVSGYPKRVGTNWEIAIDKKRSSFDPAATVDAQHRKYATVDIPAPTTVPSGYTLYPVYPGTNQIIPTAKPVKTLGTGDLRYTFYAYTLVDPAFRHEEVDLVKGEFYKMLSLIEFRARGETEIAAQAVWTKGDVEVTVPIKLNLISNTTGEYHIVFDNTTISSPDALWVGIQQCQQLTPDSVKLRYWYRTIPENLPYKLQAQISALTKAICFKTAADLPVADCGCVIKAGYIFENQQRFDKVKLTPYQGMEVRSSGFTEVQGRLRYEDILSNVLAYSPLVML